MQTECYCTDNEGLTGDRFWGRGEGDLAGGFSFICLHFLPFISSVYIPWGCVVVTWGSERGFFDTAPRDTPGTRTGSDRPREYGTYEMTSVGVDSFGPRGHTCHRWSPSLCSTVGAMFHWLALSWGLGDFPLQIHVRSKTGRRTCQKVRAWQSPRWHHEMRCSRVGCAGGWLMNHCDPMTPWC